MESSILPNTVQTKNPDILYTQNAIKSMFIVMSGYYNASNYQYHLFYNNNN